LTLEDSDRYFRIKILHPSGASDCVVHFIRIEMHVLSVSEAVLRDIDTKGVSRFNSKHLLKQIRNTVK